MAGDLEQSPAISNEENGNMSYLGSIDSIRLSLKKSASKSSKASKVSEDIAPKKSSKKDKRSKMEDVYTKRLDAMEKAFNITSSELNIPDRLSTGTLVSDLLTGGGLVSGTMVQISGKEKGGKSTTCMTILRQALLAKVPVILYWDAENALTDPNYAQPIIGKEFPLNVVFFGPKKKARLYQEAVLEDFYNSTKALMRSLPDKMYRSDTKKWYFIFNADQKGRAMMADFGYTEYDKELYRASGRLWCPTDKAGLQGIVFCDSYPALVPADEDEAEESSKAMALDARAFSKNIKKVKGVLKRKGFLLVGVNQIRLNPGVRMGNPEYEPGGEALKFYSDVRNQNRPRAVPTGWSTGIKSDGQKTTEYGMEKSIYGKGTDSYSYIYMQNTKNKTKVPYLGGWARIWFKDHKGKAHGFDPVFDTYQYYKTTGRVSGNKKNMKFDIPELKGHKFTWEGFKLLVLAETTDDPELRTRVRKELKIKQPTSIRAAAFKEIRDGKSYDMLSASSTVSEDDDLEA